MRWLRFAAFGALVPLALFALLASSVAPRERMICRLEGGGATRVSICRGAAESHQPVYGPRTTGCGYRSRPRQLSELMRDIEAVSAHFSPPDLPFDTHTFVPVVLREPLFGTAPQAGCQPADGRTPQIWPERATRLGIREGWVLVEFDVSETGGVENARVIDAAPHGVFEASALRAIGRWCYRPALQDGSAVTRTGTRVRLSFESEGTES